MASIHFNTAVVFILDAIPAFFTYFQVMGGTIDIYCTDAELSSLLDITKLGYKSKIGNLIISGKNNITEIKAGDLKGLKIENIEMFNIPLKRIDTNAFQGVKGLERLFILRSPLFEFSPKLGHLKNMVKLNLNKNNITYISKGTFENEDSETVAGMINLNENNLGNLNFIQDVCNFRKTTVQLKKNPIICDCAIYEIIRADVFKSKSGLFGHCNGPKYFRRTNLMDLNKSPLMSKQCNDYCAMEKKISIRFDCKKMLWVTGSGLSCKTRPTCENGELVCPGGGVRAVVFDTSAQDSANVRDQGNNVTSSVTIIVVALMCTFTKYFS